MNVRFRTHVVSFAIVVAAISAGQAKAVIFYQEDFEGWTDNTPLETLGVGTVDWAKRTSFDSIEVTSTHGTLDGMAVDGSTQVSTISQYGKYRVPIGALTGMVAQTMSLDMYTTTESFENLFGYAPLLSLAAGPGGWELRSPGNPNTPLSGTEGLNTRVRGMISLTGFGPGTSIYARIKRYSDGAVLGSAHVTSDTTGYGGTAASGFLNYWMHEGRVGRRGYDIDNIVVRSGFVPEPSTCMLVGLSLIGLVGYGRRKRS